MALPQDPASIERQAALSVQQQPTAANWQRLALARYLQNNYTAAIPAFREALQRDATLWTSHLFLGASLYRTNQFAEAVASLERADRLAPATGQGRDEVDYWLGAARIANRDPIRGVAALERLLARRPRHIEALQLATTAYADSASAIWNRIADRAFSTSEGQEVHGHALESDGNLEAALDAFRAAQQAAPRRPGPSLAIARVLTRQGKTAEAAAEFARERTLDPASGPAAFGEGLARLALGQYPQAVAPLEAAVRWAQPGDEEPLLALAQVYLALGRKAEAATAARRATEINPASVAAKELLQAMPPR